MLRIAMIVFAAIISQYLSPWVTLADIPPNDANHQDNPVTRELGRRLDELVDLRFKDVKRIGDLVTRVTELEDLRSKDMRTMTRNMKELTDGYTKDRLELTTRVSELEHILASNVQKITETGNAHVADNQKNVKEENVLDTSSVRHGNDSDTDTDALSVDAPNYPKSAVTVDDSDVMDTSPLAKKDVVYNHRRLSGSPALGDTRNTGVRSTVSTIAFHAHLGSNLTDTGREHTIKFDRIITNVGSNYDPGTGLFTCTQPGAYVFSWSIYTHDSQYTLIDLVRNGYIIANSVVGDIYYYTAGSATAVINLSVGDEVWVRVSSHTIGADIDASLTMFTGFLI